MVWSRRPGADRSSRERRAEPRAGRRGGSVGSGDEDVEPDPHREGRWRIARRVANRTISTVPQALTKPGPANGTGTRLSHRTPNRTLLWLSPLPTSPTLNPSPASSLVNPRNPHHRRLGLRVRSHPRNVQRTRLHTHRQTHRTQTPHQTRLPPRRLRDRHRSPDSHLPRRTHHPHTSGRQRPLLQMVQRLPPAGTVHHLEADVKVDKHHDLRAKNKARCAKDETQNTYRTYRPPVERAIAWLTRHHPRRVPYRG